MPSKSSGNMHVFELKITNRFSLAGVIIMKSQMHAPNGQLLKTCWHLTGQFSNFGFGEAFIQWIKTFYNTLRAAFMTNNQTSQNLTLQRGTRQGCRLSPSLFTLFIEPRAAAISQNSNITGIHTNKLTHKISLYADDVLLFLQNPNKSEILSNSSIHTLTSLIIQ